MYYSKIFYNFIEIITDDSDKEGHYYRFFQNLLPLPFPLSSQLYFRLAAQFKLPVPWAFLHPFLYVFTTVFCNNSCNLTKQLWCCTFEHLAYLSSSEKVLFTAGCLFCVAVQLMVIIFNLAVISVFDCFV